MFELILHYATTVASYLILIMGSLVTLCLLLYPIYFLLNNVLYKRMKSAVYFLDFIQHRKEFKAWQQEKKKNVFRPTIRK